ncbi:MAG: tetratricopeptide repeat protein [Vicinamibacterales bacterium]
MRRVGAAILAITVAVATLCASAQSRLPSPPQEPPPIKLGTWDQFDTWLSAIEQHVPGGNDEAVRAMLRLDATQLESLFPYMVFTLRAALIREDREPRFDEFLAWYGTRRHQPNPTLLPARVQRVLDAGIDRFLKRAAVLHADIAITVPEAHLSTKPGTGRLIQDGRDIRDAGRPWHWILGRSFLHLVWNAHMDPHVRLWYQVAGNHLLASRDVTEAKPHLARGAGIFPLDAEMQFLRGFMHEGSASPEVQAAIADRMASMPVRDRAGYRAVVRSEGVEHADALDAFTQAVKLDPAHTEARVRLGRALTLNGEHDRAVAELRAALGTIDHKTLRYFAQLFLGRAEELRGGVTEARAAYQAASALFPEAQSPRLALSQLELQAGNPEAARAMFIFLEEAPQGRDPWWSYFSERLPGKAVWLQRLWSTFAQELK